MYFKSVIGHLKIQLDTLNTSDCWSMIHSQPKIKFYDSIPPPGYLHIAIWPHLLVTIQFTCTQIVLLQTVVDSIL